MAKRIAVFGADGATGREVVRQAARAGHDAVTLPDLPDECLEAWLAGWRAAGAGA